MVVLEDLWASCEASNQRPLHNDDITPCCHTALGWNQHEVISLINRGVESFQNSTSDLWV